MQCCRGQSTGHCVQSCKWQTILQSGVSKHRVLLLLWEKQPTIISNHRGRPPLHLLVNLPTAPTHRLDTERDNATASIVVEGSWKVTLVSWMQCGCNCSCVSVAPTHRLHTERDNATALIIVEGGGGELLESYATVLDAVRLPIAVVSLHSAHFGVATTKQP